MIHFLQHSYTKVAPRRGGKRIWLQGLKLQAAGFMKGASYRIDYDIEYGFIELILDQQGNRIVSGKKKKAHFQPVVDLCNSDIMGVTQGAERVRVDFAKGYIRISIHHHVSKQTERERRLKSNLLNGQLKEGTLCAGIGVATAAIHQGLAEQGIESRVAWIVDRAGRYLQVACDNNPAVTRDTVVVEGSLEEVEPELLAPVDVMQVSLPCTLHSKCGKARNKPEVAEEHETDATAPFGFLRVVEGVNPAVVVSENVVDARNSASYLLIKAMLEALGYIIHETVLNREQAGSFEQRTRYWFAAISAGLPQVNLADIPTFQCRYQRLGELLAPIAENDPMWSDNEYLKEKAKRDKEKGSNFKRQLVTEDSTEVGCLGRFYWKRRSTEPMLVREDGKERTLVPVEHCRVKGIPEEFIKDLPATLAHEGMGQSILYGHGRGIGQLLATQLFRPLLDEIQKQISQQNEPATAINLISM